MATSGAGKSRGIVLAAQYYRPPFPDRRHWHDDMRQMRAAGLNTVYLWACWGWIEPSPGEFIWDDYDELIDLAGGAGLGVVINTIAEIQPFWIHREIPDAHLVDHLGRPVQSSLRLECNVGLTPGGCTDHPEVRERMGEFLARVARRYGDTEQLVAWDLWNETRWAVNSDGHVCQCPYTLRAYRSWLTERYGTLDELNRAWQRRYCSWEDVQAPKSPGLPYTDHLEFQAFLTSRAREHMAFRYERVKAADPTHLIVAHAGSPATHSDGYALEQALARGNDWEYTEFLDGFGCSHFPAWFASTSPEIAARLEASRSAAAGKIHWVGEVQGGTARSGIEARPSVGGADQQRWVWTALARGAKAINFWCWRDEVFGRESGGFGIIGDDGCSAERLEALGKTAAVLDRHGDLIAGFTADQARVGLIFEPRTYYLDWAQYGTEESEQASASLHGYMYALERLQIPYDVLESRHREKLAELDTVVVPWPLYLDPGLAGDLVEWVRTGGVLLIESESDAYDALGFYRYASDRPFAARLGIRSLGRRTLPGAALPYVPGVPSHGHSDGEDFVPFALNGTRGQLRAGRWTESFSGGHPVVDGEHRLVRTQVGSGCVISLGTFAGFPYREQPYRDFEQFLRAVVDSSRARSGLRCDGAGGDVVQWRSGLAASQRLLFVTNAGGPVELTFSGPTGMFADVAEVTSLVTSEVHPIIAAGDMSSFTLAVPSKGYDVLSWPAA